MSFTNKHYQDIIDSAKIELDKWNNAPEDFKKRSIEMGFDLGNWYTNIIKACEQSMEPESSSPEQIQELEKELGTKGTSVNESDTKDTSMSEQERELRDAILGGMKEGPDSRF